MRRFLIVLVLLTVAATPVFAAHVWGGYHWASTSYPMPIKVGDNVTSAWDSYLNEAISDWNQSSKLALVKVAGAGGKQCRPTAGRIEVCNNRYGQNGWLGLAQIWLSGSHISQGTAKMNDTYYAFAQYNTPGWRDLVMCQEVGHDFGLGHQNEINTNTNVGSCMDYTNYPDGGGTGGALSNRAPNAHDYQLLDQIYNHTESSNSYFSTYDVLSQSIGGKDLEMPVLETELDEPWQWGTPTAWDGDGRAVRYERKLTPMHDDDGDVHMDGDMIVVTDVFWAPFDPFQGAGEPIGRDNKSGN